MWSWFRNIRALLTVWYVAAMAVILAAYALAVFAMMGRILSASLDDRLREDFEWAVAMADQQPNGALTWFDPEGSYGTASPWLTVRRGRQIIFRTGAAERNPIPQSAEHPADRRIRTANTASGTVRVLKGGSAIYGQEVEIEVARSEAPMRDQLYEALVLLVMGLPLGLVAASVGGYVLARRALAPIDRLTRRAATITAERLNDRLPVDNPGDEIGRLAAVFNDTLSRLELSFGQMRRFTSDVSHELRAPLTALKTVGEVSLRAPSNHQAVIASMLEEADRLSHFIDRLLTLSRLAPDGCAQELCDVGDLAVEAAGRLSVLAQENDQILSVDVSATSPVLGDPLLLRQVLSNLIDNAIKYTPPRTRIDVTVSEDSTHVFARVHDTGPGISPAARERIFEPFYRGAAAKRVRSVEGSGLGLAIARRAVEANRGTLTLEATRAGGCTFLIALPRATAQQFAGGSKPAAPTSASR